MRVFLVINESGLLSAYIGHIEEEKHAERQADLLSGVVAEMPVCYISEGYNAKYHKMTEG